MTPEQIVSAAVSLLYDGRGACGVSRPGFYQVERHNFRRALDHYLATGEDVLPELDRCTHLLWRAKSGSEHEGWGKEDLAFFEGAMRGETFWHPARLFPDGIDAMRAHAAKQREEWAWREGYEYRRVEASLFTSDPKTRRAVFSRDGAFCVICRVTANLTLDHIIPVSRGGGDTLDNLQVLCRSCNSRKGNRG